MESRKRPRFELVGGNKEDREIHLWYNGEQSLRRFPVETFVQDCENIWNISVLESTPSWLSRGASFGLHDEGASVTCSEIASSKRATSYTRYVVRGALKVRRIQLDYLSCVEEDTGTLLLIPISQIVKYGSPLVTAWDHIMADKDPYEEDEDLLRYLEE